VEVVEVALPGYLYFLISPLDDLNECSERKAERARYSKLIICHIIRCIYFVIKRNHSIREERVNICKEIVYV